MSNYLSEKEEFINHVCREAVDKFKIYFLNTNKQHVLKSQELEQLFSTLQDELRSLETIYSEFYEGILSLENERDDFGNYLFDVIIPTRERISTLLKNTVFLSDMIDIAYCFVNRTDYAKDTDAELIHEMITYAPNNGTHSLTRKMTDKLLTGMIQIVDFNSAILTNIIKIPYEEKKH